jgi:FMN phosphatase YigB (HAD superfamily)
MKDYNKNELPVLITDIDGVALNWVQGFSKYLHYKMLQKIKSWNPSQFNSKECFPHFKRFQQYVLEYQSMEFYKQLKPYEDALEAYKQIKNLGFDIVALTSCGTEKDVVNNRLENIKNCFDGIFSDVHILGLQQRKDQILNNYKNAVFIDDQVNNVISGAKAGHTTFLLDKKYNKTLILPSSVTRIKNWDSVINYFKEVKKANLKKKISNKSISCKKSNIHTL